MDVFGVLGLARLEAGPALVVITGIEQVGCGQGSTRWVGARAAWPAWLAGWLARPRAKSRHAMQSRLCFLRQGRWHVTSEHATISIIFLPQVATLRGFPLYRVAATEVLADSRNGRWKAADHR